MSIVSFGRDRELRKQRKALKARFCEWRGVNVKLLSVSIWRFCYE